MINPSFFGLYNAERGILTAQAGLNTVNQNISNASTPGYNRQRVDQVAFNPYETSSVAQQSGQFGQVGQGVVVQAITRISDQFLTNQIRSQNGQNEFQNLKTQVLNQTESVLGEPSDTGIQAALQKFFNSAQDLSLHPETSASRSTFINTAADLLNVFQQKATQLQTLRTNYVGDASNASSIANSQLSSQASQVNQSLQNIADLNQKIVLVQATGGHPNDLLDQRDLQLKQLAGLVDITVTPQGTGQVNVSLGTGSSAKLLVQGNKVLDTLTVVANTGTTPTPDDVPSLVQLKTAGTTVNSSITTGSIGALLTVGGNAGGTTLQSTIQSLDTLFNNIATQVNALQLGGKTQAGVTPTDKIFNLAAGSNLSINRYSINSNVIADPTLISAAINDSSATSGFAGVSDGRNALAIAKIVQTSASGLGSTSPNSYFNNLVSQVASAVSTATDQQTFQNGIVKSLEEQRSQSSGVNLDQESVDLLRYQRAYEASAKVLSTFDQMTQTILNLLP